MPNPAYSELLKDLRWHRRRQELRISKKYECSCGAKSKLQLHHRYYVDGRMPWEYPDCAFVWLCSKDHKLSSIADEWRHWEAVMTEVEKQGADPISIIFLIEAAKSMAKSMTVEDTNVR